MSNSDNDDLQIRIRPIENGFILSGNARGEKIRQHFFSTMEAIRSAAFDQINCYLQEIDEEYDEIIEEE